MIYRFRFLLLSASIVLFMVPTGWAQVDTEPANDAPATADMLLPEGSASATVNVASLHAGGADVDYYHAAAMAGQVLFGMVTPIEGLPNDFDAPDTALATFSSLGVPLTFNDDSFSDTNAPAGPSLGSLLRFEAVETDTYTIGVTGFFNEYFNGAHGETGRYAITLGRVDPFVLGGDFVDTDPDNDSLAGADFLSVTAGTAAVSVAELSVFGGDVDYFAMTLQAGDVLSAMTAPLGLLPRNFDSPDTVLGLFDSGGNLLVNNDDAGLSDEAFDNPAMFGLGSDASSLLPSVLQLFGSAVHASIPADGTYYLGVTGTGDDFTGNHIEVGPYAFLVSVVPEPDLDDEPVEPILNPATGHYYSFIAAPDITWSAANEASQERNLVDEDGNTLAGYLATITSQEEEDFLLSHFGDRRFVWIGASDAAVEGEWRWVTGPEAEEDDGQGLLFWIGDTDGMPLGFHNWRSNVSGDPIEPNAFSVEEDYIDWNHNGSREWNDVEGNSPRDFISGYFVEFGGLLVELLLGDYNGNDRIEQADLDLVLLSWGSDVVPENWIRDLPSGPIDQEELDKVLLGWGNVAANGAASVPEPSTLAVLVISLVVLTIRRRRPQVSRPSALATISDKM